VQKEKIMLEVCSFSSMNGNGGSTMMLQRTVSQISFVLRTLSVSENPDNVPIQN